MKIVLRSNAIPRGNFFDRSRNGRLRRSFFPELFGRPRRRLISAETKVEFRSGDGDSFHDVQFFKSFDVQANDGRREKLLAGGSEPGGVESFRETFEGRPRDGSVRSFEFYRVKILEKDGRVDFFNYR